MIRSRDPRKLTVRRAEWSEVSALAQLWYESWQDGHAGLLPEALHRSRTLENFHQRMEAHLDEVRVVGPIGAPLGFTMLRHDELYQLFVSAEGRGTGVATALLAEAEDRMRRLGIEAAWLSCAIGNERAARFYEKNGWLRAGTFVDRVEISDGSMDIEVWHYTKRLTL
ncbi:MAG: GNAT family N-acetyltransferase [Gemmatimonadota bacterium]